MDSRKFSLFALVIGIDRYKHSSHAMLQNLRGAVVDADAIFAYLSSGLCIPESQITRLYNEKAARANIVQSIRSMSTDSRICRGDAILIYYAGHGGEADAPKGWPTARVQMLLPYDFMPSTTSTVEGQGLHDLSVGALLKELAMAKGDNIVRETICYTV
jgi:hypothetical protein